MNQHDYNLMMQMLQSHWAAVGKYQDLETKNARAVFELEEKKAELAQLNHDIANAKAGLTAQMQANEAQHVANLGRLQAQIAQAQKELAAWQGEVTAAEAKLKNARDAHDTGDEPAIESKASASSLPCRSATDRHTSSDREATRACRPSRKADRPSVRWASLFSKPCANRSEKYSPV